MATLSDLEADNIHMLWSKSPLSHDSLIVPYYTGKNAGWVRRRQQFTAMLSHIITHSIHLEYWQHE